MTELVLTTVIWQRLTDLIKTLHHYVPDDMNHPTISYDEYSIIIANTFLDKLPSFVIIAAINNIIHNKDLNYESTRKVTELIVHTDLGEQLINVGDMIQSAPGTELLKVSKKGLYHE